jgi:hypothetical protein
MSLVLKPENVARLVFFVRGEKVMLDADLARLYRVTTGNLNKAVKRNRARFPGDFMFQLTDKETGKFDIPIWKIKRQRRPALSPR